MPPRLGVFRDSQFVTPRLRDSAARGPRAGPAKSGVRRTFFYQLVGTTEPLCPVVHLPDTAYVTFQNSANTKALQVWVARRNEVGDWGCLQKLELEYMPRLTVR